MRYSAVPFDPSRSQTLKGWWGITDSKRPGWVLFAAGEKEIKRLVASMNRDEAQDA